MVSKRNIELLLGIIMASFIIVTLVVPMLPQFGIYLGPMRGQFAGGQIPSKISIKTEFIQEGFLGTMKFSGYLKDLNNNPLSGRTISTSVSYGQSATGSPTTNSQGYYEYNVSSNNYQWATATYAGEAQYVGSSIRCEPASSTNMACENTSTVIVQPQGPIIACGSGSAGTCPVPGDTCSDFKCDYSTCDCVVNTDQEVGSDRIYTFKSFKINAGKTVSVQKVANAGLNGINGGQGGAGGAGSQVSTCNQWGGTCSGCQSTTWCATYHTRYPSYCPCTGYSYSSQSGGGGGGPSASGGTGPTGAGGSNSGGGGGTTGGQGAGSIAIVAEAIIIDGALRADGTVGSSLGGGGGGGLVNLNCTSISVSGSLTANGGTGAGCGGGGGGGYIRVNYNNPKTVTGTVSVNGGAGGSCGTGTSGANGLIHYATSGFENCTNEIDDNGNDLIDCADPGCVNSACRKSGCTAAGCGLYTCKSIAFWDNPNTLEAQKCTSTTNDCIGVCSLDCPGGVTSPTGINYVVSRSEAYEGSNNYGCFKGKWSLCNEGKLDVTQTTSTGTIYYCCRDGSRFSWRTCPCASLSCAGQGPTPSSNSVSSTVKGSSVQFGLKWTAGIGSTLSGYIFSFDNCAGSFVNSSWAAMSGTVNWSNVTQTISSTLGCTVRWRVYTNDSSNTWTASDIYSFVTTETQQVFSYSNFNCNSNTKVCNMTYTNNAGESAKIVLLYLSNHIYKAYGADLVPIGSGTFISYPFVCSGFPAGQYEVMFIVFRSSDTSYHDQIYAGEESKTITCP